MNQLLTRHLIKIPNGIQVLSCNKRQVVFIKGSADKKLLKLPLKIRVSKNQNVISVTNIPFKKLSNQARKTLKSLQGTSVALLKKAFLEVSVCAHKKLKLVGVGYKAFPVVNGGLNLIHFKLGLSHSIYFKIPQNVKVQCHKSDKIFISSNCYNSINQTAAFIRNLKSPEPYKGKGISYINEIIKLKEGKKV